MWTIRQQQADTFRQTALQKFEDEMVEHLKKFSPQHCKAAGEPAVREVIRMGIENARKYGFTNRGPVRFYIELMFMFGSYFDTDPQYPWASQVLSNPEGADQMPHADRLYDLMNEYQTATAGPNNKYTFEALRKISRARIEDYTKASAALEDSLLVGLWDIHPQKCEYLGDRPLRALVKCSFELAARNNFSSDASKALVVALMFFLGYGCARDPLHGWIANNLADKHLRNPADRSEELHSKAMLYLKHIVETAGTRL